MPESTPPGGHRTAGLRAARAYARVEQADLAELLGMSVRDYRRVESGDKQLDADARALVAQRCNVPLWFVHGGLSTAIETEGTIAERIERLESMATRVAAREEEVRRLAARVLVLEEEARQRNVAPSRTSAGRGR